MTVAKDNLKIKKNTKIATEKETINQDNVKKAVI